MCTLGMCKHFETAITLRNNIRVSFDYIFSLIAITIKVHTHFYANVNKPAFNIHLRTEKLKQYCSTTDKIRKFFNKNHLLKSNERPDC